LHSSHYGQCFWLLPFSLITPFTPWMMMTNPITPPPELVQRWDEEGTEMFRPEYQIHLTTKAAQWGADHELEACCEYMQHEDFHGFATELRAARRPKPPSLKKQAYDALDTYIYGEPDPKDKERTYNTIRLALEALDD